MTKITEERLENIFDNLVEELDLNHGNGGFDCLEDNERFIGYIEAPNNTTLTIDVDFDLDEEMTDEEIKEEFLNSIKEAIDDFDPENTFEEIWHRGFEFSAFEFVDMLREDEEFFNEIALEIEYRKEKFQEIKNKINEYIRMSEKSKIEPLSIIIGGMNDVCRYVTLPQNFPIPKTSSFGIRTEDFYKDMNEDILEYIDFVGIAGVMDGKLQPLFRFGESTLAMFDETERNEIKELINNAIKDGKFAIVVGISEASADGLDVGMVAEKVVEEFKKYI